MFGSPAGRQPHLAFPCQTAYLICSKTRRWWMTAASMGAVCGPSPMREATGQLTSTCLVSIFPSNQWRTQPKRARAMLHFGALRLQGQTGGPNAAHLCDWRFKRVSSSGDTLDPSQGLPLPQHTHTHTHFMGSKRKTIPFAPSSLSALGEGTPQQESQLHSHCEIPVADYYLCLSYSGVVAPWC